MAEVLSQSQIDALLQGINSGKLEVDTKQEAKEKASKAYDFKSPKKFTKEQLRTIDSLHENLSRQFSNYLSGLLRVFCEITVLQIEEQRYYEYSNALVDEALIALVDLKPNNKIYDNAILIFNFPKTIGFFMVDRLLGGSGKGSNLARGFTDIELAIFKNVLDKLSLQIQESWRNYISVDASIQSIETNPRLLQLNSPEDIVVIVVLAVKISDIECVMSICIPASNLAELMTGFSRRYERTVRLLDETKETYRKKVILDSLVDSSIEVKAVFDKFQLDLQDVLHLQVDDVIPLNKNINSDVQLMVDDVPWFSAKLGQTKLKKAVKISKLI